MLSDRPSLLPPHAWLRRPPAGSVHLFARPDGRPCPREGYIKEEGTAMILLGIVLLIIGFVAHIAILWSIGILLVLIGLVLVVLGAMGRAVRGRRHYY
jgi:hypothetical protein